MGVGVGMSSLLVLVLCLPAVAQLLHVLRRAAIWLPVVIATVPVVVATEATEFPGVGAGAMGRGGGVDGEKGLPSPKGPGQRRAEQRLNRCRLRARVRTSCQVHKDLPPHPGAIHNARLVPFRSHPVGSEATLPKGQATPSSTFPKHCMYSLLLSHCLLSLGEVFPTLPH